MRVSRVGWFLIGVGWGGVRLFLRAASVLIGGAIGCGLMSAVVSAVRIVIYPPRTVAEVFLIGLVHQVEVVVCFQVSVPG